MLLDLKERPVEYDNFHMTPKFDGAGDVEIQVEAADLAEPGHP